MPARFQNKSFKISGGNAENGPGMMKQPGKHAAGVTLFVRWDEKSTISC